MTCKVYRGLRLIIISWLPNRMMTRSRHHLRQCCTMTWSVQQPGMMLGCEDELMMYVEA